MRVFLMILIFAIGFSGYSAAAHALSHEFCNPMMEQADGDSSHKDMDMSDCPGHAAGKDQQKDTDQDKGAKKGKCMDCSHCCPSHAMSLLNYSLSLPLLSDLLNPKPMYGHVDEVFFSLLRPPKSLV